MSVPFVHFVHPDDRASTLAAAAVLSNGGEVLSFRNRYRRTLTEAELVAHCTGKIATFKIPRYWKVVSEFPMTVTGKVQKFRMREAAIEELGLAAEAGIKTA